jgi:chromosome segregation ATPase
MTSDRAKDFAAKQIERLDKLIAQAKDLGLSQDIIDNLQTAKEKLQKISDAKEIVSETKGINTMREKLDASKINRINIIIKQLEEKLDRLDTESQNDDSRTKIQAARDMLVELKQLVSDGKLDEVLQKIKSINKIISSIKTTSDTKATEALDDENKTDEGEATKIDSRLERIKTKIQAQEEQLNSLSESIGENDVAMQWISRAFSLIEKAKLQLDESPEKATSTLNEVDKIIRMVQRLAS